MASLEQEIRQDKFENEHVKAILNVLFTANWLQNRISAVLKPFGLTHEQFNVLRILKGSHPRSMCQKDILSRMIARSSNVTLLLRKLREKKLVSITQSQKDKREYVIGITPKGIGLLAVVAEDFDTHDRSRSKLTKAESTQLNRLLDSMRES
jgi:DNA-binding MarR family transcriptional regulator